MTIYHWSRIKKWKLFLTSGSFQTLNAPGARQRSAWSQRTPLTGKQPLTGLQPSQRNSPSVCLCLIRSLTHLQSCGEEKWGDWRPHLAMVLSNLTHTLDLDTRTITTMGDTLGRGAVGSVDTTTCRWSSSWY